MNLILCGHNHGGLVPTFIQDIKKGHTGFVGPNARLIQHNAYGVYSKNDISLLISNGITKISKSSSLRNFSEILSTIYIPEIELIHMKKSDKHSLQLINRHIYKF